MDSDWTLSDDVSSGLIKDTSTVSLYTAPVIGIVVIGYDVFLTNEATLSGLTKLAVIERLDSTVIFNGFSVDPLDQPLNKYSLSGIAVNDKTVPWT